MIPNIAPANTENRPEGAISDGQVTLDHKTLQDVVRPYCGMVPTGIAAPEPRFIRDPTQFDYEPGRIIERPASGSMSEPFNIPKFTAPPPLPKPIVETVANPVPPPPPLSVTDISNASNTTSSSSWCFLL